jgi:glycolate oxidase iron-sulfur subunit
VQHTINGKNWQEQFRPQIDRMIAAIDACVHCGFCLPTCPTYLVMNEEMDSPRGRIVLMKSALEGKLQTSEIEKFIDNCLGCLGCVTSCPSGVQYDDLLNPFRQYLEQNRKRTPFESIRFSIVDKNIPTPDKFRNLIKSGRIAKPISQVMPQDFRSMLDMIPDRIPERENYPEIIQAVGTRRGRIALLTGCVQQVLAPEINKATIRVLTRNGIEVVIPSGQACCGGLALHSGWKDQAVELARKNLAVFPTDVDAIISNAAGCGSTMKEYPDILELVDVSETAAPFSSLVMDICEYLEQIGVTQSLGFQKEINILYHDACHLAHAQKITEPPRNLLRQIQGLKIIEINDGKLCCGSAGSYNFNHPQTANQLGEMKVDQIIRSQADLVATGNIGCLIQLRKHLNKIESKPIPVVHTIQVLDMAWDQQGNPLKS